MNLHKQVVGVLLQHTHIAATVTAATAHVIFTATTRAAHAVAAIAIAVAAAATTATAAHHRLTLAAQRDIRTLRTCESHAGNRKVAVRTKHARVWRLLGNIEAVREARAAHTESRRTAQLAATGAAAAAATAAKVAATVVAARVVTKQLGRRHAGRGVVVARRQRRLASAATRQFELLRR